MTQPISDFLEKGKSRAITGRAIADVLGVDLRTVTKMIEVERRAGIPICANCDTGLDQQGYYLAETEDELREYLGILKCRAIAILKTRQAVLRKARERANNEQDLFQ